MYGGTRGMAGGTAAIPMTAYAMRKKTTDNMAPPLLVRRGLSGFGGCTGPQQLAQGFPPERFRECRVEADRRLRGVEVLRVVGRGGHEPRGLGVARDARAQQIRRVVARNPLERRVHEDEIIDVLVERGESLGEVLREHEACVELAQGVRGEDLRVALRIDEKDRGTLPLLAQRVARDELGRALGL